MLSAVYTQTPALVGPAVRSLDQTCLSLAPRYWKRRRLVPLDLSRIEHRVRAHVGGHGCEHLLLAIDQSSRIEARDLETMTMRDGVRRTGFDTISAEDAAVVIDVIDLRIALGAAHAVRRGILGGLDINAVRRTRRRAEETGYALLQSILIALQHVNTAEALLELGTL